MAATPVSQPLIIAKAVLTITPVNVSIPYGTPVPVITLIYNGFVYHDKPSSLNTEAEPGTTATEKSPVGTYPVTVSGATSANYTFIYVPGILTINPAPALIAIPNAFTPNGDGINDVWHIDALVYFPDCKLSVFNRYGSIVFQSHGYPQPWDGTENGKPLPVGTYYYIISLKGDNKPLSGSLTIIR